MSNIYYKNKNIERITPVANHILYYFIKYPVASTYAVHRSLSEDYKEANKTINYKNVHLRVKHLHKNGLIEKNIEDNNKNNIHGAINYKISSFGIFYLLLHGLHRYNKGLITEHTENPLFKFYLFPYFGIETIRQITDVRIVKLIFDYLNKCALQMDKFFNRLKYIEESGGIYQHVFYVSSIFNKNIENQNKISEDSLLERFRKELESQLQNSKRNMKIEIIEENRKGKLTDGINEILFEINEDKLNDVQKIIITFNGKMRRELFINPTYENSYSISTLQPTTIVEYLKKYDDFEQGPLGRYSKEKDSKFIYGIDLDFNCPNEDVVKLGSDIIQEINILKPGKFERGQGTFKVDYKDINLLSKDRKFIKLIEIVRERFESKYNLFMKEHK